MQLPDYWLKRPEMTFSTRAVETVSALLHTLHTSSGCPLLDDALPMPKWMFLCHVAEHHPIVLHGSGERDIATFEPRQAIDVTTFGNQRAVYAASDGLWPMYFAILDRTRYNMTLANACMRITDPAGQVHGPFYVFSISDTALVHKPWRAGTVYLLPREGFAAEPAIPFGPMQVQTAQLASHTAVDPIAKLTVAPEDFPFLADIRGHDDARLQDYAHAMQTAGPWPVSS
jgi:hypothetical protein